MVADVQIKSSTLQTDHKYQPLLISLPDHMIRLISTRPRSSIIVKALTSQHNMSCHHAPAADSKEKDDLHDRAAPKVSFSAYTINPMSDRPGALLDPSTESTGRNRIG